MIFWYIDLASVHLSKLFYAFKCFNQSWIFKGCDHHLQVKTVCFVLIQNLQSGISGLGDSHVCQGSHFSKMALTFPI